MARHFSNQPDPRTLRLLRPFESCLLLIITAVAAFVLLCWLLPPLAALTPQYALKMTANSAAGMLLAAASLWLTREQSPPAARRAGLFAAIIVLALGAGTLVEYAAHIQLGMDNWLPHDPRARFPGRPSPQTASEFTLLGLCLLTLHHAKSRWSTLADALALMFTGLTLVMFGGHLYGAIDFVGDNPSNLMANHTLFLFFCFSALVTLRRAERGEILAVLLNTGIGSDIIRLVLPAAVFAPFAFLAADAYLVGAGIMSKSYAEAFSSASAATFILFIVTWMGWRINAMERDLRDLSLTDELTGVYNRRGFYFLGRQAVRDAQRGAGGLALFYFDLDGLKHVNDVLGHETGSEMIQAFAALLTSGFREGDIIGRLGGDEFAVITLQDPAQELDSLLERLKTLAAIYNNTGEREFTLKFSAGHVRLQPGQAETLDDLVTRADGIMYQDKARKKQAARAA
jgi:diguanylate cyclase (GGDEF)-like protein